MIMREIETNEINFREIFFLIMKKSWIIVIITAMTTYAGYYLSNANKVIYYEASTRVIVGSDGDFLSTLIVMVKDPLVMEEVTEKLSLSKTPEQLMNQISVEQLGNSQIINISVRDEDPALAATIANETATTFLTEMNRILGISDVQLLTEAKENNQPIIESSNMFLYVGFILGVILGVGFIFLLDSLDGRVRKEKEMEAILGAPVLGIVSNMNKKRNRVSKKQTKNKRIKIRGDTVGF